LVYTRFVDEITIRGPFVLSDSGIKATVKGIVERHGFGLADKKTKFGPIDEVCITGVRLKRHHIDPTGEFIAEFERLVRDHICLADGEAFTGPLLTESMLFGKAHFACSLNPGRRRSLLSMLKRIRWDAVMANAVERKLVRFRDRLVPRGADRPDCSEPFALADGAEHYRRYVESTVIDSSVAPFEDADSSVTE
jgi:hypothetical protein